jgi:hypothetical protein
MTKCGKYGDYGWVWCLQQVHPLDCEHCAYAIKKKKEART